MRFGKAVFKEATLEVFLHSLIDAVSPKAVFFLEALFVDLLKFSEVSLNDSIERSVSCIPPFCDSERESRMWENPTQCKGKVE